MTAKMAPRKKIHHVVGAATIYDPMSFSGDEFYATLVCILASLLVYAIFFDISVHRVLEVIEAEPSAAVVNARVRDEYIMFETSFTIDISSGSQNNKLIALESQYFMFPDGNSDANYSSRRRPWYVEAYQIAEDVRNVLETFDLPFEMIENTLHEMINTSCTKTYNFGTREELALGPCDRSDKPQDVKFQEYYRDQVFHDNETRTNMPIVFHGNLNESAYRVQTGYVLESFGEYTSEIRTGPSHLENWISRPEYPYIPSFSTKIITAVLLFCALFFNALYLSARCFSCDLLDLEAVRRSSHGSGSSAWIDIDSGLMEPLLRNQIKIALEPVLGPVTAVQGEMSDDAISPNNDLMEPLLRDQIKIALEPVLGPVTAALLHQGREERKQRQMMIAMEEQNLALKKEKVQWLKRPRAWRFQLTRRVVASKLSRNKSAQLTDLSLQPLPPAC